MQGGDIIWFADETGGNTYGYQIAAAGTKVGDPLLDTEVYTYTIDERLIDGLIPDETEIKFTLMRSPQERIPPGGNQYEVLAKSSSVNYATYWREIDSEFVPQKNVPQDGLLYCQWWDGGNYEWTAAHWQTDGTGVSYNGNRFTQAYLEINRANPAAVGCGLEMYAGANSTGGFALWRDAGVNADGYIINNGTGDLQFWTNTAQKMTLDSSGNLGIGTTSPLCKLEVSAYMRVTGQGTIPTSGSGVEMFYHTGNYGNIAAYDRGTSAYKRLSINNTIHCITGGNVGIGTTAPSEKLDVTGGIRATTQIRSDGIIRIDRTFGGDMLLLKDTGGAGIAANPYMSFRDSADTRLGYVGFGSTGHSNLNITADSGHILLTPSGNVGLPSM